MELQKAAKLLKHPGEKKRSLSEVTKGRESVAGFSPKAKTEGGVFAKPAARKAAKKGNPRTGKKDRLAKRETNTSSEGVTIPRA